jgi:hypothetical protein
MQPQIRESDWKLLRQLEKLALERLCQRVLDEAAQLAASTDGSSHERYLALYRLIKARAQRLAEAFDDLRRSTALEQLARIRAERLLTDEEFSRFSDETRKSVQLFLEAWEG